jgi:hypothetical protein
MFTQFETLNAFFPKVMQLTTEMLSMIPKPIDYQKAEKLIGADKKPLDIVLLQEVSFIWCNFIQ